MLEKSILYDRDIREPLFDFLEETYGKVRILEEKKMGRSRADVVMVTEDAICGIEIKSDADTYTRLARQIGDYDKFYDKNYLVVGTRHALHAQEHVPQWWGIITVELVDGETDFYIMREPEENPKCNWKKKLEILWRPELVHIQEINQMPRYKDKSKAFVIDKIIEKIPSEILGPQICEELFERDYNTIGQVIAAFKHQKITTCPKER